MQKVAKKLISSLTLTIVVFKYVDGEVYNASPRV